ncbi:PREDICTED: uncharacterized protein LOC106805018 [Priapulus caudatus]|uniref:Uncharacterized protein LOC106805018 n=1 Tax=Priapulus caudatus TaxID=37621 RepID=A0ABM1DPV1_PRICU|nr:PREDICTED: uncharacterized protein LOC106805018 [Priapulus caudatus]
MTIKVEQVPDIVASTRARCTKHQEQADPVQLTALRDAVVAESEGELLPAAPPRKRKTNPKPGAAIAERVGHAGNGDGASLPDDDNDDAMATTTTAAAAAANLSSMSIGLPEPSPHPSVREMLECSLDITSATSGERHVIHHIDEGRTKGEGAPGQKVEDEEVERQRHLMKGCSVSGAQLTDEEILFTF